MTELTTNLSSAPYFDDYNENKQFYRILFVPKKAVQVREMNQFQNMIQTQIKRFGNHIFKDGSIVYGCNIVHDKNLSFVRIIGYNDISGNTAFSTDELKDFLVVSNTTGLRASILIASQGYVGQYPDTSMLHINYVNTGRDIGNNEVTTFQPNETLSIYTRNQDKFGALNPGNLYNTVNTLNGNSSQSATGKAYAVTVGEGVVYQKGYFVKVLPHTILVSKHDTNTVGKLVGFKTNESIVTHLQDNSLIDPADTSNRNGIGANRLKLTPELVAITRDDISNTDDFFPIIEFGEDSVPVKQNTDPEYTKLGDQLGKEKYETNGDFHVKPFIVSTKQTANTQNFAYTVDAGISYVKGNRVQLLNTIYLEQPRANELGFYNGNITTLNYGNYVSAKEMIGTFNADALVTLDIYDAPQTAVTSSRAPTSPTGAKVGTANVRAVVFDKGVKGTAEGSYKIYLTNIIMNSGKSFTSDAKSFVISAANNGLTYGALADIILVDGKAVIRDSNISGLIFNTGVVGSSRLRDPQGVNDTSFTFRDVSTATLQANGAVTFTLNTPYAGGSERFFVSPGTLSTANKLRIDVSATGQIITGNLPGTINSNTGNTTILGTGTSFTTGFKPGEFIRTGTTNYRVVSIANNTSMTVHTNVSGGTTTASYSKFYPAGSQIDLESATVTAVSNTQFTIGLGTTIATGAPQTLIASYPVIRGEAYEVKKQVNKGTFVKVDCSTAGTTGPFNLGIVDVYSIDSIWVGPNYSENNPDRSSWFAIDNGQQITHYDHAKLILRPEHQGKLTSASRILVKLNHFTANTTTGIGFFSVDSYPTRAPGAAANTTNISYDDIPEVFGYNLRESVDFRPQKFNTANVSSTAAGATINPVASNTSFTVGLGSYLGEPDTNFQADIEYYLPRYDLIQVNKDGVFTVKSSTPAEKPIVPFADPDAMAIATSYVPGYPGITADQSGIYSALKPKIKTNLTSNRGYTMKDINLLDKRITNLEYYQALSMLEQQAKDYNVRDENGLDRFKNGIFVDPLKNHHLGDVSNFEYNIAIDELNEIARPKIKKNNVDLDLGAGSTGIIAKGRIASLAYTTKPYISQPYASKFRNVTESVWKWTGNISLYPEYDHSVDQTKLPEVNVTVDLATPWEQFANSPFGSNFGDWRVVGSSTTSSDQVEGNRNSGITTTTTTTTTNTLNRTENKLNVSSSITKNDLGSYVTDVTLSPYMRSRQVAFIATGLRPNTRMYAYFADEPVSDLCAPGTLSPLYNQATGEITLDSGKEDRIVTRTSAFGTQLETDSNGNIYGIFNLPSGRFRVGDRQFKLIDVDDLTTGADAVLTSATAMYTASALTTNSRNITVTTVNPTVSSTTNVNTRVEQTTTITQRVEPPVVAFNGGGGEGSAGFDPLGQTIFVATPGDIPGVFLADIEVFFRSKDANMGVTCYVVEMNAGVPNPSRVLATSYLKPSAIATSNDSSIGTVFKFNEIPYLTKDRYYAWFLKPDGDSPNYTIWMSEIGGVDIITGDKIFTNPYIGNAVLSANSESWDNLMTEDIKFNARIAYFNTTYGEVEFTEQDDEYLTVDGFAMANTSSQIHVGDVVYTVDSSNNAITGGSAPFGIVQAYDQADDSLVLDSSTGGFASNTNIRIYRPNDPTNPAAINPSNLVASSKIVSVDNIEYSIVVPQIATVTPTGTSVAMKYAGMDISGIADATMYSVMPETELEMIDKVRVIRSKSNRVGGAKSASLKLELTSHSPYLSPIIDLRRRSMMAIDNIINNDISNEHTRYGNALVRYISKSIALAEGQDSEDVKVFITAYRPADTDIHCYMKVINADDPDTLNDKLWTKLDMVEGASVRSSSVNVNDYREFGFSFPSTEQMQGTAWVNPANDGIVQYRNSNGTVFIGYKQFAFKIVLTAVQKSRVPRIDDIRGLCLQV